MARRYNDGELEQLKRNVSITRLCSERGIELKPHGTRDLIGRCPFHDDEEPSFIVTPDKNLFHCMGCDAAGSVIDLVMKLDGLTFREAVDKLLTSTQVLRRGFAGQDGLITRGPAKEKTLKEELPVVPAERAAQLLERAVAVYEKNLAECPEAGKTYLEHRGITDVGLLTKHRVGYSTGKLPDMLPGNGNIRTELKSLGILSKSGAEHFTGCVVFPVLDVDGNIVTLYGRFISGGMPSEGGSASGGKRHVFLPRRPTGLWNAPAMKTHSELIVVESVLDALSVEVAGFPNVVAIQGTNGLADNDIEDMKQHGVSTLTLLLDGDDAGAKAAERLSAKLGGSASGGKESDHSFSCTISQLPDNLDPNAYLLKHGAQKLAELIKANPVSAAAGPACACTHADRPVEPLSRAMGEPQATRSLPDGFSVTYGLRTYQVLGLDKGPRKLKATIRAEANGKLHVDTLDFYSARSRRMLAQDLCRLFDETPETIEADITRLLQACEKAPQGKSATKDQPQIPTMSPGDKKQAETFGRRADIIDIILDDYSKSGLVGEESNKLLCYLAAVSRKMDEPLSVLILSSSGAGKTALQDCTLSFVPPEDLLKLTSLSGKALFYKDRLSLKHKVLALEEGGGAEEATYAIRNLISAGELVIESTIKDLATGRLTTMENRVEGPTTVFITTTDPDTDPETRTRFWVTSIDESREQTRAILTFQRKRQTLDGVRGTLEVDAILKRHRNFQRLLKPLAVVNPFAERLTYEDDRLQGRRDHPKYLNLIKAVAFLRQMQRNVKKAKRTTGETFDYIEVLPEDVQLANRLAHEILGHSLGELSRPSRTLLMEIEKMVREWTKDNDSDLACPADGGKHPQRLNRVAFSRRQIREYTGWSNYRVHTHLKELSEYEYVSVETDRATNSHRYRLQYEGQGKDGEKFMLGLSDPDKLTE